MLQHRVRRALYAKKMVLIFKPNCDNRYCESVSNDSEDPVLLSPPIPNHGFIIQKEKNQKNEEEKSENEKENENENENEKEKENKKEKEKEKDIKPISLSHVVDHDGGRLKAQAVSSSNELERITLKSMETHPGLGMVAIDEVQFFDEGLPAVCERLVYLGLRVVAAGLDTDFRGIPFSIVPELLALANKVNKLSAICMVCGASACRTQRLIDGNPVSRDDCLVLIGGHSEYRAVCRLHHVVL